ncbi:FFLEELY motif protein [Kinneretia aquatilis]|uniref:FFLEELY motif protein n=1 Tax=Kinneretia aquatilis TaxID=2070761 RepID=UPI0014953248|nr:hypothetical protein [Paucibacter aquatile]WIV98665.1 hypothetical protein K9V56_003980 [Paucibacter aquatile]
MSRPHSETILSHLHEVERQREYRLSIPGLPQMTEQLKQFQQMRFRRSYADLLAHPRYTGAAQFFLDHLYGPGDFSRRDAQFARVVPTVVRLFPSDVVSTVAKLAELHALSEDLDTRMAEELLADGGPISPEAYLQAWQETGMCEQREMQIELTIQIGAELERLTRKPLLRQALRMMRGPAGAAGLSELQSFLEVGFDTFRAMKGADEFLSTVDRRERALCDALFETSILGRSAKENSDLAQIRRYFSA